MSTHHVKISPSFEHILDTLTSQDANLYPMYTELLADLLTPVSAYLKISSDKPSFLFESVTGGEHVARYSFLGTHPQTSIRVGDKDPLLVLESMLKNFKYSPGSTDGLPIFTGGAVGYLSYDCVQYFEPKTKRPLEDPLSIPDAIFYFFDTIVVFDHVKHTIKIISQFHRPNTMNSSHWKAAYDASAQKIKDLAALLMKEETPLPLQPEIELGHSVESNTEREGYEAYVHQLKKHIVAGDIIQAVPSQRLRKKTRLHPFNAYRHLRSINPSPYMFYIDFIEFQTVGASPEMLVKVDQGIVTTHPIAGTRKRGKTPELDKQLEEELLADEKERAEHIMLVDLGRNDVNRVCVPETVQVNRFMQIERYAHVMHIVSSVSGRLREGLTSFDAFRSIFPAGTVSGAPKIKAIELVYDAEKEKRGIYAGAVGYFSYTGSMDTCIAIRTMVFKDGYVYLQAGAGIVYDSDPFLEYQETLNKLMSNVSAIERAEQFLCNH